MAALIPDMGKIPTGAMNRDSGAKDQTEAELRTARVEQLTAAQRRMQLEPLVKGANSAAPNANLMAIREHYNETQMLLDDARLRRRA